MIILALYALGMRVEEVDRLFTELALRVFRGRDKWSSGWIAALISCSKGQFSAADIDECLLEMFGCTTMLQHPYMSAIGARIGFPVVDARTCDTHLITSYNGTSEGSQSDQGSVAEVSQGLRSTSAGNDILIRDAWVYTA